MLAIPPHSEVRQPAVVRVELAVERPFDGPIVRQILLTPRRIVEGRLFRALRLTLVTAQNDGWRNLWVPKHAIYVDASINGKASPALCVSV